MLPHITIFGVPKGVTKAEMDHARQAINQAIKWHCIVIGYLELLDEDAVTEWLIKDLRRQIEALAIATAKECFKSYWYSSRSLASLSVGIRIPYVGRYIDGVLLTPKAYLANYNLPARPHLIQ
jgi:hypothetical protein